MRRAASQHELDQAKAGGLSRAFFARRVTPVIARVSGHRMVGRSATLVPQAGVAAVIARHILTLAEAPQG